MVLMDIEKAFDRVWHNALIYKMYKFKFPKYLISERSAVSSFCCWKIIENLPDKIYRKNRSNLFHIEEKIGATQRAIEYEKLQN
jgi:hypothetical protein